MNKIIFFDKNFVVRNVISDVLDYTPFFKSINYVSLTEGNCVLNGINDYYYVGDESMDESLITEANIVDFYKPLKINELNEKCEQTIEKGFLCSNGHWYRVNRDDQINMIGQKDELTEKPDLLEVKWKTEDVGYVIHTRSEWLTVYFEAFTHKQTQLFKYDDLKTLVSNCSTMSEINNITW